jgi:hypothetical protein
MGCRERWGYCANKDMETFWITSGPQCISHDQGLNAQAKGEVPFSRRNGAEAMHLRRRDGAAVWGGGEEVLLSRKEGAADIFLLATTGGSRNLAVSGYLEVRTSGADLGLEQSVVVLRAVCWWPAFDPLFFWGGGGPNSEIRTIALP